MILSRGVGICVWCLSDRDISRERTKLDPAGWACGECSEAICAPEPGRDPLDIRGAGVNASGMGVTEALRATVSGTAARIYRVGEGREVSIFNETSRGRSLPLYLVRLSNAVHRLVRSAIVNGIRLR